LSVQKQRIHKFGCAVFLCGLTWRNARNVTGHGRILDMKSIWENVKYGLYLIFISLPTAMVLFPLLLFVWLHAWLVGLIKDAQAQMQMRRHQRTLGREELIEKIRGSSGTLIIESTTASWGLGRVWWTEDNIPALCPVTALLEQENDKEESQEEKVARYEFTKWAHQNYTNLQSGRAKLVKLRNGYHFVDNLSKRFPGVRYVHVWSGGLHFLQIEAEGMDEN
jgi:hypothetical protein